MTTITKNFSGGHQVTINVDSGKVTKSTLQETVTLDKLTARLAYAVMTYSVSQSRVDEIVAEIEKELAGLKTMPILKVKNIQSEVKTNHDKLERIRSIHGVGINGGGEIAQFLDLRLYMARSRSASVVYCDLWVRGDDFFAGANGKAGGYGYCKQSAASNEALLEIFEGFDSVGGRGMNAVEAIIKRIGVEAFGLSNVIVIG